MINNTTSKTISPSNYKKTKILATIGPSTNSYELIYKLIEAGANGIRLNFSHGDHAERVEQIKWIRKASKALNKPVAILQDLQGPKIRLGDFEGVHNVAANAELRIAYGADYERTGILPVQYDLSSKLKKGERVYLYDGRVRTSVTAIKDGVIYLKADNDGILIKRKGINIPDTDLAGDVLTKKDLIDLAFGSTQDIDYVAISFVQSAADVELLRRHMNNHNFNAKIVAKLETKPAMDNLISIIEAADMLMVARGDLAPEVSFEAVPVFQERIVAESLRRSKPVIVATQVLASMTDAPEPTRAEASDVAMATFMGADVIMLSDETANGRYPVQSVEVMKKIIRHTEANRHFDNKIALHSSDHSKSCSIAKAVVTLAEQIEADVIVAETSSGATANIIAALRPSQPQIAVTSSDKVAQQLALVYGIKSYVRADGPTQTEKLTAWLKKCEILKSGDVIVTASGKYPGVVGHTDTIKVRVLE
jgi:pyruvate kinase